MASLATAAKEVDVGGRPLYRFKRAAEYTHEVLAKGKVRCSTPAVAKQAGRLVPSALYSISGPGKAPPEQSVYTIRFTVGAFTWSTISIRLEGEEIVVLDAMRIAA
jgi:hypothetical protein